jgi:phosphinothricin acetyltransferase
MADLLRSVTIIDCELSKHGDVIRAIFNDAILNSTALYEYQPRSAEVIERWFCSKQQAQLPVIGAIDSAGQLLGFASYGLFRDKPAAHQTMEHSLYIHPDHRGKGLGEQLLRTLIQRAEAQQVHLLVGAIDADNQASIRLHQKLGFDYVGTLTESAYKFGRWLDLALYQKHLNTAPLPEK